MDDNVDLDTLELALEYENMYKQIISYDVDAYKVAEFGPIRAYFF
jgi:hypothetical protein